MTVRSDALCKSSNKMQAFGKFGQNADVVLGIFLTAAGKFLALIVERTPLITVLQDGITDTGNSKDC